MHARAGRAKFSRGQGLEVAQPLGGKTAKLTTVNLAPGSRPGYWPLMA